MHTSIVVSDALPDRNNSSNITDDEERRSIKKVFLRRAETTHGKLPGIRKIPLPAIGIIVLIALINLVVWAVVGIVLVRLVLIEVCIAKLTTYSIFIRE
jgi:high-affinity nickel-transport protein